MYFLYVVLSSGFTFIGVICFWVCVTTLNMSDWNLIIGGSLMLLLFGLQSLVNRTRYTKELRERVLVK